MRRAWLLCGSRSFTEKMWVKPDAIDSYLFAVEWISGICHHYLRPEDVVIHGGAVGVDKIAAAEAFEIGCTLSENLPDYENNGPRAPLVRDLVMLDRLAKARSLGWETNVIAIWDGVSNGTRYTIDNARNMGWDPIVEIAEPVVSQDKLALV